MNRNEQDIKTKTKMKNYYIYNKVKGLLMLTALLLAVLNASAQTSVNELTIGDISCNPGKLVTIPISLNNTDEVVTAQFDIELPFAAPSDGTATLSNRSDQHSVSYKQTATNTYRVVIINMENRPLRGNSGLLLRLPMQTASNGQTSAPYFIYVSNIVLTDNQGNNIATSDRTTGNLTLTNENLPDLTLTDITAEPTEASPGGDVTISYNVKNSGTGSTLSGWTEKLYLEALNGTRTYIGSQAYESVLAAGGTASRSYKGQLPTLLHIDGEARIVVEVVPNANTGELIADQGNNSGLSDGTINLSKQLFLTANTTTVREGISNGHATLTLSRSGDWSLAETFTVGCSVSSLLTCNGQTMPCTVTIPARVASVTLRIASVNDNIVRTGEADINIASDNGYKGLTLHLDRTDDDTNPLTLTLSAKTLAEGSKLTITGTRGGELTDELTLNVACTKAARFDQPFVLHFDKGASTAQATATAIRDGVPQIDAEAKFTATAKDYQTATASLLLTDDDRPAISFTLSQPSVVENASSNPDAIPLVATIRRDRGTEQDMVVWLTSSRNEVTFEKNKVTIPAGSEQVQVALTVTDNSKVDGQRTATLTAALYLAADQQAAPVGDRACSQQQLTIIDDEQPYLTLTSRVSAVAEGSSAVITVHRYMPSTSQPLTVTLSTDDKRISFASTTITIPAGSTEANATITVARNSTEGDDKEALLTASATGLNQGQLKMLITDRTLPDAVNPSVEVSGEPFYSGLEASVRAIIRNVGTSELPKGMTVNFYLASASSLGYYTQTRDFFQATTSKAIPAGGEETFSFTTVLPQIVGQWWVYARLNADNSIKEFNTGNNLTQAFCPITINAPFEVETITASPEDCLPGGIVTVQGRMKAVPGSYLNGQTVQVELTGTGQRTTAKTEIDAVGNFNVSLRADRSAHGYMTVKALALGQTEPARTTQIHVYNMSLTADKTSWTLDEGTQMTGSLKLQNLSAKPINVSDLFTSQPMPDNAEITFDKSAIGSIAAGATISIPYTVKALKPSSSRQQFTVTAKSEEGLESNLTINYYCLSTNARLEFTPRELKTTMLFNADREGIAVKVKNTGKKASGNIAELIQGDWLMSDFGNNRTLQPGEEATIHLSFLAQDYMHTDRSYTAYLQLTPENGASAGLPITVKTTGDELSDFDLTVTDVYSLAQNENIHVAGASVTITNKRSGEIFLTGTIGNDGHWRTTSMKEGQYEVKVETDRHKTVRHELNVGPGEDCSMTVILPYKAVVSDFVIDQDLTNNTYTLKQYIDIDKKAPQGTIVAEISDNGFGCGNETMEITLRNEGLLAATNIQLSLPTVNGYTFQALNAMPSIMQPGDTHILQVSYTGPDTGTKRVIAKMRLYYEFNINGEILSEEDFYQTLVGCTANADTPEMPVVEPEQNDTKEEVEMPGIALPAYNSLVKLEFENLSEIRCGQPLQATLRVRNGQNAPLSALRFTPQISNLNFEDRTSFFDYSEGKAKGFMPDSKYWLLGGEQEGILELKFTPQAAAAAEGPSMYYISGQVSYTDSKTSVNSTVSLPLMTIVVQPSGDVQVTYLIQQNFLGDDADTDETEAPEPTMFAMLARNLGPIAVSGFQLEANQPIIVGNNTAKSVPYTTEYAAVDGQAGQYTFTDFNLENIDGAATATAHWIYTSEKSAHIRNMATLTDGIKAATGSGAVIVVNKPRELFRAVASRSVTVGTPMTTASELELKIQALAEGNTYLLNDIDDEQRLPDGVMTAGGEELELQVVSQSCSIASTGSSGDYQLTVNANASGWVYGQLHDPTNGLMRLESVRRLSDNKAVRLANFWQTDRTPQADYTMIQEKLLHFADEVSGQQETYLLHFEARQDDDVQIMGVKLYTADGTVVNNGGTTTQRVSKVEVEFNDAIRSLYINRMLLTAHCETQNLEDAVISSAFNKRLWTVDLNALPLVPGEHTLTIDGDKLKTLTGKAVKGKIVVSWTEKLSGSSIITISVAPDANYGSTSPGTGSLSFGEHQIEAKPAEGYEFVKWTESGSDESLSTDPKLTLDVWKAQTLTAHFAPKTFNVSIECGDEGLQKGYTSGVYKYGEEILLAVQPLPGFLFDGWTKNGQPFSSEQSTTDFIKGQYHYVANFKANPESAFLLGDADGSGEVSYDDVNTVINVIMGLPVDKFIRIAADVNKDGMVNIVDLTTIIKMLTNKP